MHFKDEFDFLSNFYPSPVIIDGWVFATVEHAYQAEKTVDTFWRERVQGMETPGRAKREGRKVPMRPDWDEVKVDVMRRLLIQKFAAPTLRMKLLAVEGEIVEDNSWGDTFWGVCDGVGENMLGKLLMEVRDAYKVASVWLDKEVDPAS